MFVYMFFWQNKQTIWLEMAKPGFTSVVVTSTERCATSPKSKFSFLGDTFLTKLLFSFFLQNSFRKDVLSVVGLHICLSLFLATFHMCIDTCTLLGIIWKVSRYQKNIRAVVVESIQGKIWIFIWFQILYRLKPFHVQSLIFLSNGIFGTLEIWHLYFYCTLRILLLYLHNACKRWKRKWKFTRDHNRF